jgi:hypothetical protein
MSASQHSQLSIPGDRARQRVFISPGIEIIDAAEMAARLRVKESWVIEETSHHAPQIRFLCSALASIAAIAGDHPKWMPGFRAASKDLHL